MGGDVCPHSGSLGTYLLPGRIFKIFFPKAQPGLYNRKFLCHFMAASFPGPIPPSQQGKTVFHSKDVNSAPHRDQHTEAN